MDSVNNISQVQNAPLKIKRSDSVAKPSFRDELSADRFEKENTQEKNKKILLSMALLAGIAALGVWGHKTNWWRGASKKAHGAITPAGAEAIAHSAETKTEQVVAQRTIQKTSKSKIAEIKTLSQERLDDELQTVLARETEEARPILEEFNGYMSEVEELFVPRENFFAHLDAKGISYTYADDILTIKNPAGQEVKKIYYSILPDPETRILHKIEYINPETAKVRQVMQCNGWLERLAPPRYIELIQFADDGQNFARRLFRHTEPSKRSQLFIEQFDGGFAPLKRTVLDNGSCKSCMEYDPQSYLPEIAFAKDRGVFVVRDSNPAYLDLLGQRKDVITKESLGWDPLFTRYDRITKSGYYIENGGDAYGRDFRLLDRVTGERRHNIELGDDYIIVNHIPDSGGKNKSLWIGLDGEVQGNTTGKTPLEVLEEVKSLIEDLRPEFYKDRPHQLADALDELIGKLSGAV